MRKLLIPFLIILTFVASIASVHAQLVVEGVKVDQIALNPSPTLTVLSLERGQEIEVEIRMSSLVARSNVEVQAFISGYEYNNANGIFDRSQVFDMQPNTTYVKRLNVKLPTDTEVDSYKLRVLVSDRFNSEVSLDYNLRIDAKRHSIAFKEILLNPQNSIMAGRALLATVRLENYGQRSEKDVRVQTSIPELGVSAVDYINEIKYEDQEQTEELYLKIPACANHGTYNVITKVTYENGRTTITKSVPIQILSDDTCDEQTPNVPKTQILVNNAPQTIHVGSQPALWTVTITNKENTAQQYAISVTGEPQETTIHILPTTLLVVQPKTTQIATITATPTEESLASTSNLALTVTAQDSVAQTTYLPLTIIPAPSRDATPVLETLLVVLVLIAVVLAILLIISPGKKQNIQTYY